jgi:hypothetical protein
MREQPKMPPAGLPAASDPPRKRDNLLACFGFLVRIG